MKQTFSIIGDNSCVAGKQVAGLLFPSFLCLAWPVKCATAAGKVKQIIKFLIISNGSAGRQGAKFIFFLDRIERRRKDFSQLLRPPATFACVCLKKMEVNETKLVPAAEIHTQQEPEVLVSVTFAWPLRRRRRFRFHLGPQRSMQ